MPLFLEYDKTNRKIVRILTADNLPVNVAYLAYQEVPEGIEIDASMTINEALDIIMKHSNEVKVKIQEVPPTEPINESAPIFVEA
jgi:hypothetical protein